ncbi:chemotaxis protein CheW [Acidihalobacter aeolianus]|nr:chemotaxis protein CheW [Acidihalobacter aeolianus]
MDKLRAESGTLFAQEMALSAYLEGLLTPVTAELGPASAVPLPAPLPSVGKLPVEPTVRQETALKVVHPVRRDPAETVPTGLPIIDEPESLTPKVSDNVVPAWASDGFECLLFYVGGLKLAVPLVKLTRIVACGERITKTPGRAPWFMGIMRFDDHQAGVVDTAKLVFPRDRLSRRVEEMGNADSAEGYSRILMVEDGRWGLCCDRVDTVVSLSADAVRWRTEKTTRRWLAGTVTEQMCALLDVESLTGEIEARGKEP